MVNVESPAINPYTHKEDGEINEQKPFLIRGHRFGNYASLINKRYLFPGIIARLVVLRIRMEASEIKNPNNPIGQSKRKYAEDIIGTSKMQLLRFRKNYSQTFSRFLRLSDDYPAEIVEGIPNIICNGCAIGEHCKRLIQDMGEGKAKNTVEEERKYTDKFIEALDNLGLPQPTITYEPAYFSDAEPQQIRRIKTTIGTIKQVLKQTNPETWY